MAQADELVVKISADTTVIDKQLADLQWQTFLLWEQGIANKGSGMTNEQMTGARVYHDWVHRLRDS